MSCRATKFHRREIRKAVGQDALDTLSETQTNLQTLANSITLAHKRLDAQQATIHQLQADLTALGQFVLRPRSLWDRMCGR